MLEQIKNTWNITVGLALVIVVFVSKFIVLPNISLDVAEGSIDYEALSKFIVAGILLLLLVPCAIYKKRKHAWKWWMAAAGCLVASLLMLFVYYETVNHSTAYNEYAKKRMVIGQTLQPDVQHVVDSLKRHVPVSQLSPAFLLDRLGQPKDIWNNREIEKNSQKIIITYLACLVFVASFIVCSIQAIYCTNNAKPVRVSPGGA